MKMDSLRELQLCHAEGLELIVREIRKFKGLGGNDDFIISGAQLMKIARIIRSCRGD